MPKPGWKTTEFWLSILSVVLGATLASGLIPENDKSYKLVFVIASSLAALGYTAGRSFVKSSESSARVEAFKASTENPTQPQ